MGYLIWAHMVAKYLVFHYNMSVVFTFMESIITRVIHYL